MNFRLFFFRVLGMVWWFLWMFTGFFWILMKIFLQKKHGDFHKQPWDDLSKSLGIRIE